MKKSLKKKILIVAGALIVVIILAVVVLLLNINNIATAGIEKVLSHVLGVEVTLKEARVSLFAGGIELRELRIGNPEGFKTKEALSVNQIKVKTDLKSFRTDQPHIFLISLDGLHVTLEQGLKGSNLSRIIKNASGSDTEKDTEKAPEEAGKKIRIDQIIVDKTQVGLSAPVLQGRDITFPIPRFEMQEIGGKNQYLGIAQACILFLKEIVNQIREQGKDVIPADLQDTLKDTFSTVIDGVQQAPTLLKQGKDQIKEGFKETKDGLKGLFGKKERDEE